MDLRLELLLPERYIGRYEVASIDFNIVSLIRECLNNMSYNFNPLVCWHVRGKLSQYDGITVFEFIHIVQRMQKRVDILDKKAYT